MLPIILGLGAFYAIHRHVHNKALAQKPVPPPVAKAHGDFMLYEFQPDRLEHAARVFGAEGFPRLAKELTGKAQQVRQQAAAVPDIVQRARAGDQNAMAMITACRENAVQGNPRAAITCSLIEQYCRAYPKTSEAVPAQAAA